MLGDQWQTCCATDWNHAVTNGQLWCMMRKRHAEWNKWMNQLKHEVWFDLINYQWPWFVDLCVFDLIDMLNANCNTCLFVIIWMPIEFSTTHSLVICFDTFNIKSHAAKFQLLVIFDVCLQWLYTFGHQPHGIAEMSADGAKNLLKLERTGGLLMTMVGCAAIASLVTSIIRLTI